MLLIADGHEATVQDTGTADTVLLTPDEVERTLGWRLEPYGLCRGDVCVPLRPGSGVVQDGRVDLAVLAQLLDRRLALDCEAQVAALAAPGAQVRAALESAPDLTLGLLDGGRLRLSDLRGRKVLVAAWASWCLCRHDLEGWEAEHRALEDHGLAVVTVALDRDASDARPWTEAAGVTHLACVDPEHCVAEAFGIVNVPTVVWLGEDGRVVRPPDTQFATPTGAAVSGLDWEAARAGLRRWVLADDAGLNDATRAEHIREPTPDEQLARAHWQIARALERRGDQVGMARHLERAGQLAPHDFTIRRAGLVLSGRDPFGADYWTMREELLADGGAVYRPLPDWQAT